MLRFTVGTTGFERVALVSDGTDVAGLPDGPHRRWEGTEVVVTDGVSRTPEGGVAGGVHRLADAVRFMVQRAGVPLPQALAMASAVPAASVGATA
jgi:N-acetylglucosamine-6-phosphate deacetylase